MANNGHESSARLEMEVDAQRHRVESTIDEIKERLTPGQLVDEVLSYTGSGGAKFASNLGQTLSANPVPAALLGVSLAWLMAGPRASQNGHAHQGDASSRHHEHGRISGRELRRTSHAMDDRGLWHSEFADMSGKTYRARSDDKGNRLGHFMDESGKTVSGFVDESGNLVEHFRDEAGNLLDQATGWASHMWEDLAERAAHAGDGIADRTREFRHDLADRTRDARHGAMHAADDALHMLRDQPLITAALAFAAGAAIGLALPPTRQEDEAMGELSDEAKSIAASKAGELYEEGKEKASEVYDEVSARAGDVYETAKDKIAEGTKKVAESSPRNA